jgi:hypothetical protein
MTTKETKTTRNEGEGLNIGEIVIVTEMYGRPKYKGIVINLTRGFAEIRELDRPRFWPESIHLERLEYVQKCL